MLEAILRVGIGEMKVAAPPSRISAVGIGSCVAVALRDRETGVGGMAHIMLPWMPKRPRSGANLLKYADFAIDRMVEEILRDGGRKRGLGAKIIGGAHMFEGTSSVFPMDIGGRNIEAVKRKLDQLGIPIIAEDTGGNWGRSVELRLADGLVCVRSVKNGELSI